MMKTFGSVLDINGGAGPGFNFLRIALAFGVLGSHAFYLIDGSVDRMFNSAFWMAPYSILPMFFCLSGFLVSGSALRNTIPEFLTNRALRILPALAVEIVLSVLVLGPLLTRVPLSDYFSSPTTQAYFLNIIGYVHYYLPGLFETHPVTQVNGSLWTVPHEIGCYAVITLLMWCGALRRPLLLVAPIIVLFVGATVFQLTISKAGYIDESTKDVFRQITRLVPFFVSGCVLFILKDRIPYNWPLFVACLIAIISLGYFAQDLPNKAASAPFRLVTLPFLAYITVFIGLTNIPPIPLFSRGDYSYGVYLYGYPIQQTILEIVPSLKSYSLFFLASALLVSLFAAFSWHVIEKPILKLRKIIEGRRYAQKTEMA